MPVPDPERTAAAPLEGPKKSGFSAMRRLHERQLLTGVSVAISSLLFAIFAKGPGKWNALVLAVSFASYFVITGLRGLRQNSAFPVLSASLNLLRAGKLAQAESLLATLTPRPRPGSNANHDRSSKAPLLPARIAVHADLQRAQIAMRRGDPGAARDLLDTVITRADAEPDAASQLVATEARGLRAWARAVTGDLRAQADIDAVRSAASPSTATLAHAALAGAFVAQRRADRVALAAILRRDRRLLMYGLDVRERALVRAMQRLLATPATSIYRTPASVEKATSTGDEPPIAEWIGRVAPELRPFAPRPPAVPSPASRAVDPEPEPSPAMLARVRSRAETATSDGAQGIAVWSGFFALAMIVYKLGPIPTGPVPLDPWIALAALFFPVLALGGQRFLGLHRRNVSARLMALSSRVASGEAVDADLDALSAAEGDTGTVAAQIELLRAAIADRRGLLGKALEHADAARAKLETTASRASAASFVSPSATASRAYSLAALRRADEALAELSQLPEDYVHKDSTRFVVRLVSLVALGQIEAAGRLADATPQEISIGPRDELLRDLVRAATSPGGADVAEIARLREELRDDEEHRLWIERVAPDLLACFERAAAELAPKRRIQIDTEEAVNAELLALAEEEAESRSPAQAPRAGRS